MELKKGDTLPEGLKEPLEQESIKREARRRAVKKCKIKKRLKELGIDYRDYLTLHNKQGGVCACCELPFTKVPAPLVVLDIFCLVCPNCYKITRWLDRFPEIGKALRFSLSKVLDLELVKKS